MSMDEKTALFDAESGEQSGCCGKCGARICTGNVCNDWVRPLLAEFTAVTIFTFIATLSVVPADLLLGATAQGLTITLLVVSFGHISGGHVNPAVTFGLLISGKMNPLKALLYVVFQILGGLCGAALTEGVVNARLYASVQGGLPEVGDGTPLANAMLCELILTFILVITVLLATADDDPHPLAPAAIGMAVLIGVCSGGAISGGAMNPARALGPAIVFSVDSTKMWREQWIYWVGPLLGASLAAILYRVLFASDENRLACTKGKAN